MKWKRVDRRYRVQPRHGSYGDWKDQIAMECGYQCVYCAIHEDRFGGRRNYHVDHFRPKAKKRFERLMNEIQNLYYSCSVCNCFKSDEWPADPAADHSVASFIDPADSDFNDVFEVGGEFGITSKSTAGTYMIERLFLNRSHLLSERRFALIMSEMKSCLAELTEMFKALCGRKETGESRRLEREITKVAFAISETIQSMHGAIPYHSSDQKRKQKGKKKA